MSNFKTGTKCVQSGWEPKNGEPRVLPIYQSTTYKYDDVNAVGDLFDMKAEGHMYSRISNPTAAAVEEKIADLEGGSGAMLCSSGQMASMISVLNITSAGQNILASASVYGGTVNLFAVTLKQLGIETRFFTLDMSDEEIEGMIDENTRLIFGETIANPVLTVFDIERYANLAHKHEIPLVVDNTFATPILCRPFEWGADIVIHSTTKYMDGHAAVVGGCVIDGGKFNWKNGKFPEFTEPDESYHGVIYCEKFGVDKAYIMKAREHLMRDFGAPLQPITCFMLNLGLETLHLRVKRHSENAMKVAEFLSKHEKVSWVNYPKLKGHSQYALAEKYLPDGASGVISFGVNGGREAAIRFMNALKLAKIVVHVADARTSVLHPASSTHRQLTDEQLIAGGITPDLIRFSVGIEDAEDIIADLSQALDNV